MDTPQQIEQYLEALAVELDALGVAMPYHFVITGGAYLILHQYRKYTEGIEFAFIAGFARPKSKRVIRATVQRMTVASLRSTVPSAATFRQAVTMPLVVPC